MRFTISYVKLSLSAKSIILFLCMAIKTPIYELQHNILPHNKQYFTWIQAHEKREKIHYRWQSDVIYSDVEMQSGMLLMIDWNIRVEKSCLKNTVYIFRLNNNPRYVFAGSGHGYWLLEKDRAFHNTPFKLSTTTPPDSPAIRGKMRVIKKGGALEKKCAYL